MVNLFKAFLYKLSKDLTFRITLIVGAGLAVVLTLIYFLIDYFMSMDGEMMHMFCTGESLLIGSLSPTQNFGLAIPINLITFTVLEFTHGTIRNKIIAGNSKGKVYVALYLSGLIFTLSLMITYVAICFGLGSAIGRFHPHGTIMSAVATGQISPEFLIKQIVLAVVVYVFITTFTIFFATLFRNVGPCIPIVIIFLMICYFSASMAPIIGIFDENSSYMTVMKFINPLYALASPTAVTNDETFVTTLSVENDAFIAGIIMNLVYSAIFFVGGLFIFKKRDIK